jgi:hypothetical protein
VSSPVAFVNIEVEVLQIGRAACNEAVQLWYSIDNKDDKVLDDYIAMSAQVEFFSAIMQGCKR